MTNLKKLGLTPEKISNIESVNKKVHGPCDKLRNCIVRCRKKIKTIKKILHATEVVEEDYKGNM